MTPDGRALAGAGQGMGPLKVQDNRVLPAVAEQWARMAIVRNLLSYPGVRNDRESHPHEEPGVVGKRTETREPFAAGAAAEFLDHAMTET